MARKIEAEFSKGVIIPLEKLDLEEGKKIMIKDGVKAMWYLIKYRFID